MKEPTLERTVSLMLSNDSNENIVAEYIQAKIRVMNMLDELNSYVENADKEISEDEFNLYKSQIDTMFEYIEILLRRMAFKNINILDYL